MQKRFGSLVFSLLVIATGCVSPMREAPWVVVESDRFEIFSTLPAEKVKALATELERFHALVYAVTNAPEIESAVPTRIYALARRSEYSQVGVSGTAGTFSQGLRQNQILISGYSPSLGASEIILHEYVHFVLRNGKNRPYPLWYDEGLADYFSTVVRRKDLLVVGAIPKSKIQWFEGAPWLSTERIIAARAYDDVDGRNELGMFYAQSWALVHYLTLDREPGSPSIARGLPRYLELVEGAMPTDEAYRAAFGELPGKSGLKIRGLLDSGGMKVLGIPIAKLDYDRTEPKVRVPGASEVAVRLGQLHLSNGKPERAEAEFQAAIALDAGNARAQAGLGDALKFQNRYDEAEPYFEQAVELDPEDPLNHIDLAEFYQDRGPKKAESIDALRADLARAREIYRKVIQADPRQPETLAMLGISHLAPGEDPRIALGYLEKAFELMPSSPELLGHFAESHLALGDEASARLFLTRMLAVRGVGQPKTAVDQAIAEIRKRREEAAAKFSLGETTATPAL